MLIALASPPHDKWSGQESDRREQECEPESNVFLGIHHTDLTDQSANVDEEVKVMVDTTLGDDRVDNNFFTGAQRLDICTCDIDLFGDQGGDVRLETTGAETHDNQTEHEQGKAGRLVGDDRWNR